jgi:hypothetical protein
MPIFKKLQLQFFTYANSLITITILFRCQFFNYNKNSFITGIMQQDNTEQVIIDPKLIAHHYIRTW